MLLCFTPSLGGRLCTCWVAMCSALPRKACRLGAGRQDICCVSSLINASWMLPICECRGSRGWLMCCLWRILCLLLPLTPAAQYLIQLSNQTTGVTMGRAAQTARWLKLSEYAALQFRRPWTLSIHQPCLGPQRAPQGRSSTSVRGDGSGRKKKARREKLPFMRRVNSIFTPRDLSFSFGSPSQARHASNLVAQYRERQAAGDKDAGPPSSAGGKSRGCIRFFPLPFHPPRALAGLPQWATGC